MEGAEFIVLAYFLASFDIISSTHLTFHLLNLAGAEGLIIISLSKKVYQTVALNILWARVAFVAIMTTILF